MADTALQVVAPAMRHGPNPGGVEMDGVTVNGGVGILIVIVIVLLIIYLAKRV